MLYSLGLYIVKKGLVDQQGQKNWIKLIGSTEYYSGYTL